MVQPAFSLQPRCADKLRFTVPVLGLGCAQLGGHMNHSEVTDESMVDVVHFALERGITFLDTAPRYKDSERRLGLALRGITRDQFVLATKVSWNRPEPGKIGEFSREAVLRSVDESLKRLELDYIDILHIHDPVPRQLPQILDETFPALAELRNQGIIRAIGSGMMRWELLAEFARSADFDCFLLAARYTLLEQGALDLLDLCCERRIAVFLGGIYNTGILATGSVPGAVYEYHPAPPHIIERVQQFEALCATHGIALPSAALQFPLAHPVVKSLVFGAINRMEVQQALDGVQAPIPPAFWRDVRAQGLVDPRSLLPA